jgi:hypothetical protein
MIEWTPIVFVTFKALVLGTGMFFAIKWHYDKGKKENGQRAARRALGKVGAVFVLSVLGMALVTFVIIRVVGLDLRYP